MKHSIDIVIPWVDGNDPKWKAEKKQYDINVSVGEDDTENRYRDWGNLQFLFRGIDKYMPWINNIFFITWGHIPEWLNTECSKIKIVNHKDYIPEEYLPTFSSHTIELNIHRIKDLSERFILFNDDTFILREMKESDFFDNKGFPCDRAILKPLLSDHRYSTIDIILTGIEVINDHFDLRKTMKDNLSKWYNIKYGKYNLWNYVYSKYKKVIGFQSSHYPNPYLKSSFAEVWEKEHDLLDSTCRHKFRTYRDVNQHLIRFWQIMRGNFAPSQRKKGKYAIISNDNHVISEIIENQTYSMLCLNENAVEEIDFEASKEQIISSFTKIFPDKCQYER